MTGPGCSAWAGRAAEAKMSVYAERIRYELLRDLLRGGSMLFGERVEAVFPDQQPFGKSNAELAEMIEARLTREAE